MHTAWIASALLLRERAERRRRPGESTECSSAFEPSSGALLLALSLRRGPAYFLLLVRQCEHVESEAIVRRIDLRSDRVRHEPRAAAAFAGGDGDVLLSVDAVRHREALNCRRELLFPENLAGLHVYGFEHLVAVSDKRDSACGRYDGRLEGCSLLEFPDFFQRLYIVSRQLAEVAVAARAFIERPVRSAAVAVAVEVRRARHHDLAGLNERRDQDT